MIGVTADTMSFSEPTHFSDTMNFSKPMSFSNTIGVGLRAERIDTLQVNVGYRCNQSCKHCHVSGGPNRAESMNGETVDAVLEALDAAAIPTLDVTGGAPELNPHFRRLVSGAAAIGSKVIVRTNLTVFFEPGCRDMPQFFRDNAVEVTASLPYYLRDAVDRVRGAGVFDLSIEALRRLNAAGYGEEGGSLRLNLAYNPPGAYLPAAQDALETEFAGQLHRRYGIKFNGLFALANAPLGRFREFLDASSNFAGYMAKLRSAYNPCTLERVMCRRLLSVGFDGGLYDCDFNQAAGVGLMPGYPQNIRDYPLPPSPSGEGAGGEAGRATHDIRALSTRSIAVGEHCYSCTAGAGST
jgi:radical SAM/Cys-rich protein